MKNLFKKISAFTICTIMASLLFFSCNKMNELPQNASTEEGQIEIEALSSSSVPITLTANEIATIANHHNVYLKQIFKNFNYKAIDLTKELEKQVYNNPLPNYTSKQMGHFITTFSNADEAKTIASLKDPVATTYIQSAKAIIKSAKNVTALNQAIDQLVKASSTDKTLIQKDAVKVYCAVLKNSYYFWADKSIGGSGDGEDIINFIPGRRPPFWFIIAADAAGAIIGTAASGGIAGGAGAGLLSAGAALMRWGN